MTVREFLVLSLAASSEMPQFLYPIANLTLSSLGGKK